MRALLAVVLVVAALVSAACNPVHSTPADATAQQPESPVADAGTWDQLLKQWIEDPAKMLCDAPGGVLLVDSPAGRYLAAAGVASVEDQRPLQTEDRFQIGSSTKSFTTVLALQLQEEGVLSLDDPLSRWLPELAAQLPYGDQITLRQLAGHTSGIWDYEEKLLRSAIASNDRAQLAQAFTPEELVQYVIANGSPDFAPGTGWKYSNTGYILLGLVVEAATGQSLADLYQARIFDPLGMTATSYLQGAPQPGEQVDGYFTNESTGERVNMTNWNASQGGAAGAIVSTAADMARYVEALLNGKLFKQAATLAEMLDFRPLSLEEGDLVMTGYGLGIMRFNAPGYTAFGHSGQTPGFDTVWFVVPEANTLVIFNTNSGSCHTGLLPLVLKPEAFGLTAATQGDAGASVFPRPEPEYTGKRVRDLSAFDQALAGLPQERSTELDELLSSATVLDMQTLMDASTLTAEDLVTYYVARIKRYDIDRLNAVMELNPNALAEARALDAERAAGNVRGPLHGIPVLLKDNIAAAGMHTTAGAYALKDWQPDRDAFLVQRLRAAGAVILGKANLSEWANYMDPNMPSGFSALGGQTRNPYGPYDTLGSSSGSAVAAAASLAAVTVGSETQGSLIMPAAINSVVAIKPSMGLVSRDYVVPLLSWQDVPGPMGRTVSDVAVLLTAMTGVDANDPVTEDAAALAGVDFAQFLAPAAANGLRVGILVSTDAAIEQDIEDFGVPADQQDAIRKIYEDENVKQRQLGETFSKLGLEVVEVDLSALPGTPDLAAVLPYGFRADLNHFLTGLGDQVAVGSLEEIIAFNNEDLANRAPYGQGHLKGAQDSRQSEAEYLALKEQHQSDARDALQKLFADYGIDVLVTNATQAYAPAGLPAITVPAGYDENGQPAGITMLADYLGEPELIAAAHAFEQATQARVAPDLDATIAEIDGAQQHLHLHRETLPAPLGDRVHMLRPVVQHVWLDVSTVRPDKRAQLCIGCT